VIVVLAAIVVLVLLESTPRIVRSGPPHPPSPTLSYW
jgi:hypothetical protein